MRLHRPVARHRAALAALLLATGPLRAADPPASIAPVRADHDRGLYVKAFALTLSTATPGAMIRYTTDGSLPTPAAGTPYTGPIPIDTTTVVHTIAYQDGLPPTDVLSCTYVFPAQVLRQPDKIAGYPNPPEPINNPGPHQVNVPLTYGMNPRIVDDPQYAKAALAGLSQIPTLSIGVNPASLFGPNGFYDTPRHTEGVKVPVSFEFIDPHAPQNNVGVIAGISSHASQKLKRSFHLHFSKKFGPGELRARIFDTAPFGSAGATTEFDDLILRAGNNRSWAATGAPDKTTYTEDEFVRATQIAMTGAGVHGTFVHLYLNGIYWGLYNLVERPDDGYGAAYFGSDKKDYFSVSQNGVASGDDTRWNVLVDKLARKDLSVAANYAEVQKYLDVKQFADYLIGQWFCGVSDWPTGNFWAGGDTAREQPFRFYAWDGEVMINTVNRFPKIPNGPWVNPAFAREPVKVKGPIVKLWTALKRSPAFMAMFEDEVKRNIAPGGPLSDAAVLARWDTLNAAISDAIVDESARWGNALTSTGRPTYTRNDAWLPATRMIADDLKDADAKFVAALRAEGYFH